MTLPFGIAHHAYVLQGVDEGAVLAAQCLLAIAQGTGTLDGSPEFQETVGRGVKLGRDVGDQQFFTGLIAEHAHQRIVDLDKTSLGRGKEQALLNAVEELAVTLFGFAAVGDVLKDMDGLRALVEGGIDV